MDLCDEKKFINLNRHLYLTYDNEELISIMEDKNNCWTKGKIIDASDNREVIEFRSIKKKYVDLVIKIFSEDEEELEDEIKAIKFFSKDQCRNFIRIGYLRDEKLVIMEKLDGDIENLDFRKFPYPHIIFNEFVKFLVDALKCIYKHKKLYTDIKLENFGYKICDKNIKFAPLDFGSFVNLNSSEVISTIDINRTAAKNGNFSRSVLFVFGTVITLLFLRLKLENKKSYNDFDDLIYKLNNKKRYPKIDLLDLGYFKEIKEFYYSKFKKEDEFVKLLFDILFNLTKRKPRINDFLDKIDFYD